MSIRCTPVVLQFDYDLWFHVNVRCIVIRVANDCICRFQKVNKHVTNIYYVKI